MAKGFLLAFLLYSAAYWYARIDEPVWVTVLLGVAVVVLMLWVALAIDRGGR